MVSLQRSTNTNSGGVTFFGESGNMEDREFLQPILASYGMFKPVRTPVVVFVHLLSSFAVCITGIVFATKSKDPKYNCREYFIVIYTHVGLWFLTLVVDYYVRAKHYGLRINGYLDFYRKTKVHHRLPFYLVSLINGLLLVLQAVMQHFYQDNFVDKCIAHNLISPISYLASFILFEFCLLAVVEITYIAKIQKFNNQKPPPDVQKEEWNSCSLPDTFAQGEIGFQPAGDKVYEFLEKQADLIRHLKDHNARLGEKLMVLNAQLQSRNRTGAES